MTGCSIEPDPGWFSPELMMNVRDLHVWNLYGEAKYQGSIDGLLFPSNAIELLVASIGTDAITGTVAPYTHTISQANSLPSLTVEKNIGAFQSLQFAGCRVGKFSLKVPTGNEAASITVDVSGQSAAVLDSPTAVSITNELPFVFAEAATSIFGTSRTEAHNVEFNIDNGLKETYTYSSSHGPSFITPVTVHASGMLDVVWDSLDDSTYGDYLKMENGTLGAFSITLTHPTGGGYSVQLNAPQVAYSKYSNDLKVSDVVLASLSWEASKALPSSNTVGAVVLNQVSTAY
jgi:hypothetical protein